MFHLGWVYEEEGLGDVRRFINEEYGTPGLIDQAAIIFNELLASWTGGGEPKKDAQRRLSLEKNSHALEWYRKSAELGFIPAMNNLGQLYLNGALGYRDAGEAFRGHLAAAEAGNFIGAMNVGMAFRSGLGVAADPAEAQRWSQWKSSTSDLSDLTEPTFERTYLPGRNSLPPQRRHMVRVAAARGEIVTMSVGSLKPNDKLPTFKSVVRGFKN
jgi:hypothetical protein